ncbi:MAG: methyl-accepting chemotaxis sensory transducer [Gemmatimonadetes bacterium]|nr:methyl-accepting chemotaxis sensory transducer [Gemmatimonadota bacterium]
MSPHLPSLFRAPKSDAHPLDARLPLLPRLTGLLVVILSISGLGAGLLAADRLAPAAFGTKLVLVGLLGLVAAATLVSIVAVGSSASAVASTAMTDTATLVQRIAGGDYAVAIPASDDASQEQLHEALRRMVRMLRANATSADALAAGAYHRAMGSRPASDPVGQSLVRVAAPMDGMARTAQQVARGNLVVDAPEPAADDSYGQAHAAMIRKLVIVMAEVEGMKASVGTMADQMRDEAEQLAAAAGEESDRLRRAADRMSHVALQARATADRSDALDERAGDNGTLVEEGAASLNGALESLRESCRRSEVSQELARNAGLLAIHTAADSRRGPMSGYLPKTTERDVRALADQAGATALEIGKLTSTGISLASESLLVMDRIADGVRDSRSLTLEITRAARAQADELAALDAAVAEVHETARRSAARARRLASRADALAAQRHRMDVLLRRFQQPVAEGDGRAPTTGPALYNTPPHAQMMFPKLALVAT